MRQLAQEGIEVLEHVGNSPNINAIEGAWMPMRIAITQCHDLPLSRGWSVAGLPLIGTKRAEH